ncbi:bifunctional metallophosphatase/5'-nucleotidase [Corynebacterium lowii]|uniref:Endonuclease YhcR n=1 Tax=Corynebacterium lowii TaxID=1544413 RepID=A0A0N8W0N1_9CORY|nr:bifunctional UDP-sugar hydrolase/5'-nucleotidase [Corynebacterium lowii]KQB87162.1 Endonuclease YhcR precursor [Corynebacterium lowii]MDP9852252.1 5'-nucleotidase [Corynebacterium lowii]
MKNKVVAVVASTLMVAPVVPAWADEPVRLSVQNITDFHGHFSETKDDPGAARLSCALDRAAEGGARVLTSSGDNIGGSPFNSAILRDEPTIEVLNQMGLDATAVGNHEFDKGYADLTDRVIPNAEFAVLGANVTAEEPKKQLDPFLIREIDGVRVALIGAVTADTPQLVAGDGVDGVSFADPVAAVNLTADTLVNEGQADVVVALLHEGVQGGEQWSKNVDIVFPGHTHQVVEPNDPAEGPLIVQAGQYGRNLVDVDLSVNRATKQVHIDAVNLLDRDAIRACDQPNPEIAATVSAAELQAAEEGKEVVSTVDTAFYRGKNRAVESQLNNLLAEVAREGITKNTDVTADIGVMNAGGVRADLEAGEVTYADAFAVQPFGNENTYTTLKGADFKEALEQQWQTQESRPALSLGLSDNVSYTYDPARPIGDRVTSITIDGAPLDPARDYVVAGSTFLLGGGDGFEALTRGTDLAPTGYIDVESFIEYLRSHPGLKPRAGQSNVAVTPRGEWKPGSTVTLDLASLIYSQGETATTVTAQLGDSQVTAPIDPDFGHPDFGEAGKATVELSIPANLRGEQHLTITTDAGTRISLPVTL